jgi:hypothetical protein
VSWIIPKRVGITTIQLHLSQQVPSFTGAALLPHPEILSSQIEQFISFMF